MALWSLSVLGAPSLSQVTDGDGGEVRFRYRDTWLLLASLALDPEAGHRETLILRLGLDVGQTGRDKLRFRLNDLRHGAPRRGKSTQMFCGIGAENVLAEGELITLRSDVVQTDLRELEMALKQASTLKTPAQRVRCLRRGAALLRGAFLEGYELAGEGDGWLERMRFEAEQLSADVWLQLAQALDDTGERRSAFDAARKAYTLRPENPETLELLLSLADGAREQEAILLLSQRLGVEELLPRLEALERDGLALTVTEELALGEAVKTRLSQLSQRVVSGLLAISGFPQDFTAEQALAVCAVSGETLERITHAFPLTKRGERYSLLPALRAALQSQVSPWERQAFRERHTHYWNEVILQVTRTPFPGTFAKELLAEAAHLTLAGAWYLEQPASREGIHYLMQCCHRTRHYPTDPESVQRYTLYLERAVEEFSAESAMLAAEFLGQLALERQDFSRALSWFQVTIERFGATYHRPWRDLLIAAHHAAQDEVFDAFIPLILQNTPPYDPLKPNEGVWERADIQFHIAENRMARGRFEEALEHNDAAFSLQRQLERRDDNLPVLWGQRAGILQALGRTDEAERCWDWALRGYEKQGNRGGVAECYQEVGKLLSRKGSPGLGCSLVKQAIAIFEEVGNPGAVAATQGTLGDILRERGELDEARRLYETGLAFWKERQHPRWTAMFERRLQLLEEMSGKMPT